MDDLIRRQEAIEHLKKRLIETAINNVGVITRCDSIFEDIADNRIGQWLNELPGIIRCKDCKWKRGSECVMFAEVRPSPDDFCSRAKRRKDGSN